MNVTPEELVSWDRPGPRYTSYPTVPVWGPLEPEQIRTAIRSAAGPVQVYVHVPFCQDQCWYCGCNMVVARRQEAGDTYLDALEHQVARLPGPGRRKVVRIHLGGGTPTWLAPMQIDRLFRILSTRFDPVGGAEVSVEVDPMVTTGCHLEVLHHWGVRRLSIGVQSFDPDVLEAVNRPQGVDRIVDLVDRSRNLGWTGLNLDLMYGLPHQTVYSFRDTLEQVLALRPDRLAVFGFAYLPERKRHQKKIDADALPDTLDRATTALLAQGLLQAAGYRSLGLDHFSLPDDELAVAQSERRLHRNFMGYTTLPDVPMIGLGHSAISEVNGVYWQDQPHLGRWLKGIRAGESVAMRGWVMTEEDHLRRHVINELMCNLHVDVRAVEERFGIDFWRHFADAREELRPLEDAGFVVCDDDAIEVTERGRVLVRLAAMPFDAYLRQKAGVRYSQAV